ncbi:Esterase FE4 [Papilio machaon]|uniref:Carboxylic ester hydrolase n=1 Tax=Papilio machaon TaxID=76193 RepID=A0A194RBS7_PAPMA|nr:Esterase FE4 [Papilio machaon]
MKYKTNLVLFTLFAANLIDQPAPEVTIAQGILSGKISADGTIFEYIGIPYASTNSSTRFKAPGPPPSWHGVFKAVDEIHFCPQSTPIGVLGSEDCLKINVYVPALAKKPLPVMVYIHGGAFLLGGGGKLLYGPDFLVKKNVILVTFNYRLGALGFTCLRIKEAPGNAGLKDQVAALRWVKKNIAAFGGDPNNITLFGESAGATSTAILLASNVTDGLINRAIIQSGSSTSNWSINRNPVWVAGLIAETFGLTTKDPLKIYELFSKMSYKELVSAKVKKPLTKYFDTQLLHLPCVEEIIPGEDSIISDLPYNLLTKKTSSVPLIYGSNSKEGFFLISGDTDESLEERNGRYLFASDLLFKSEDEAAIEAQRIQKFYFGDDKVSMKKLMNVSDIYTHLYFEIPPIFETEMFIEKANAVVYNYYFDYSGGRNFVKKRAGYAEENGACHADELFYLFNALLLPFRINKKDMELIDTMTTLWTNFAKYGDPTPNSKLNNRHFRWMPSTKKQINFLYINDDLKMGLIPNPKAYNLWKTVYEKYRKLKVD